MKKITKLIPLVLGSLLTLSSCSLFNDDDMIATNSYNPPVSTPSEDPNAIKAGGVTATTKEQVPGSMVFKNICYATNEKIENTYGEGEKNHLRYNINDGEDYYATTSSNNYDLYVPESAAKNKEQTIILFVHGGAWVSGFKTDVNDYLYEFTNKGFITATIKYTLLKEAMDDPSLSIFRNLDEIDACIGSIKAVLGELGFDVSKAKLAICGFSSGSHLSMLYAYSRGEDSPIPIKFIIDCVGPVDIVPDSWKQFANMDEAEYNAVLDAGIGYDQLNPMDASKFAPLAMAESKKEVDEHGEEITHYWNDYQTIRVANGMCGLPFSLDEIKDLTLDGETIDTGKPAALSLLDTTDGGEAQLSVTHWIDDDDFPIISVYGGKDSIVGIAQFARLEESLRYHSVTYESFYFRDSGHTDITKEKNPTEYEAFVNKVDSWAKGTIS